MATTFDMIKDRLRREGQRENAERLSEMAGGAKEAAANRKNVLGAAVASSSPVSPPSGGPPSLEKPAVLMDGTGKYVYERVDADTFKIVKSPHTQGGQIVTRTSSPSAFAAIQDDVAKVATMKSNGLWDAETGAPKFEAQIKGASTRPRARVEALTEEMTLEAPTTPTAPAPMPTMADTSYESAQRAVPQGSRVPPPSTQAPRRGSRTISGELSALPTPIGMEGGNPNRTLSGETGAVLSDYRSGVQLESNARSVIDGLVRNKMDPQAAKALVDGLRAQGPAGAEALRSLAGGLFDERIMVATGRK